MKREITIGAELEFGDAKRVKGDRPDGATWNTQDYTCVSSTGIGNDPLGKAYAYGGEINTLPFSKTRDLTEHVNRIITALCPRPVVNYRSNLHFHVRVPGLENDLPALKRFLRHSLQWSQAIFRFVEPIPVPIKHSTNPDVYVWEMKRYKRRLRSHHSLETPAEVCMALQTHTPEGFHAALNHNSALRQRAGINLRSLAQPPHTIEFRHFPGTLNMAAFRFAAQWCIVYTMCALEDGDLTEVFNDYREQRNLFPKFPAYDYEAEQVYQFTTFKNRTRATRRMEALRKHIDIDAIGTVTARDVLPHVRELEKEGL